MMNSEVQMSEDCIPTDVIKDDHIEKLGVSFTRVGLQGILVHNSSERIEDIGPSSDLHTQPKLNLWEGNAILYDPELRKLINESNATFIASRNISSDDDFRTTIVDLSREHRSTIRQCLENMENSMADNSNENYNDWVEVLENTDHIWHLCELLYLESNPGDTILPKLLEWIRLHSSSDYDFIAAGILSESHTKGANHRLSNYWELVYGFLIEGRIDAARALLKLHSDSDKNIFVEAEFLLRGMPKFNAYCGLSVAEFNSRWRGWKSTVQNKIKSGTFLSNPELQEMMMIIDGGEESFQLLKKYCPTWYQMLVAYLFFNEQTVKIDDLSYHANQCISKSGLRNSLKILDFTLLALLDHDLLTVIQKLESTPDHGWSAVHLSNLLLLASSIENNSEQEIVLERMLINYGRFLSSHRSYWQVAVTYFEHCKSGPALIETLLKSVPITNKNEALKVISVANDYNLQDVVTSVCNLMIMKDLNDENLASALSWAILSSDSDAASNIADRFLEVFAMGNVDSTACTYVLGNLGQSVLINGRLTFLAKYCDFHTLFAEDKIKEAAELLIKLLESKVAPKYFWLTLLLDSLTILRVDPEVFSYDEITILLASLEEVTWDVENVAFKTPNYDEKILDLRTRLANCFATSLINESCPLQNRKILKCFYN